MEHAEKTLLRLVEERLKALETNAFAVEKAAGLPADAVRSILRGGKKSGTTLNRAKEVCEALGLEFYIGPKREVGPIEQVIIDGQDFAHIPLHAAALAAGDGAQNGGEIVIDHLAFRRSWLRKIGISANSAVLARASGDSMMPTIHPNDLLLIDTAKAAPPDKPRSPKDARPAPIYALLDDGAARVKRLAVSAPGTLALLSDNPATPPDFRPLADVHIIGKVMWWGHTNRE